MDSPNYAAPQPARLSPSLTHAAPQPNRRNYHRPVMSSLKPLKAPLAAKHPAGPPSHSPPTHQRRPLLLPLAHRRAVRHQLRTTLLPLRVLDLLLAPARASLSHAEEGEGEQSDERDAADGGQDGDLGRVGEGAPLLLDGLGGGGVVVAVEGEGFGVAV